MLAASVIIINCIAWSLFAAVNVDDFVLVDVLEDVGGVHQDPNGAHGCHDEEHVELQAIYHHGHKLPVFSYLENKELDFYF